MSEAGAKSDTEVVAWFLDVFLQGDVPDATRDTLARLPETGQRCEVPAFLDADDVINHRSRAVAHLVLTLPEYQLA